MPRDHARIKTRDEFLSAMQHLGPVEQKLALRHALDRQEQQRRQRSSIPPTLRRRVYDRDGWACVTCKSASDLTLDHVVPWSLGGADTEDNLQTLCRPCNARKGART